MSLPGSPAKSTRPDLTANGLFLLLGLGLGIATAYLVVMGSWQIALGLIAALPALILLHRHPFLAVIVWLTLGPFLMTSDTVAERMVYWVIHRALPPATVGLMVLAAALRINGRRLPRLGWAEVAMLGYVVASLLSIILLNDDPLATTYRFYDRVVSPMCLYLIVRLSAPSERDLERLVRVAFFLGVSQSLIGLLSWIAPQVLPSDWLEKVSLRTTGSLVNPSTYTTALVFAAVLILQAALNRKPGLVRTVYMGGFVLANFCVFLSLSRASWLGGSLVMLGLIALYPKFMLRLGLVVLPAVILLGGGLLAGPIRRANERLYSEEAENSALSRLPVTYAAYQMFQAKPVLGWGYDNFDLYDRRFYGRVANFASDNKDHASHNVYLTTLAEQGLLGFTLYLAPLVWWLALTLKALPGMPREGIGGGKLLIALWLAVLNEIVVNNFTPMWVVVAHGLWWVMLGLIAHRVHARLLPDAQRAPAGVPWGMLPGNRVPGRRGNPAGADLRRRPG